MTRVLVFGTFDGLHKGHESYFMQASKFGQVIAIVGRDSTILKTKKKLPKFGENERLKAVQESQFISEARLGNEGDNPYKVVEEIKPDIICLGYDQTHFVDKLEAKIKEMGLTIEVKRLNAFEPEKYHSSILNKE